MHKAAAPKKIAALEIYCPAAPIAAAVRAFPAASKALLRPVRADIALRPTRPRLIAAIAGVTMPPVSPCRISAAKARKKVAASAKMSAETAIIPMPSAAKPRFHGTQSTIRTARDVGNQAGDRAG